MKLRKILICIIGSSILVSGGVNAAQRNRLKRDRQQVVEGSSPADPSRWGDGSLENSQGMPPQAVRLSIHLGIDNFTPDVEDENTRPNFCTYLGQTFSGCV